MSNPFTRHPHSVGETYWQHLRFAARFGGKMALGGLAALVHSMLPFCFVTTASRTSDELVQMRAAARGRTVRVVDAETLQPLDWQI
jgi:hypothetical protein